MVRQANLHLISKMRSDAALYPAIEAEHSGSGAKPKYGKKIDVRKMDAKYPKETSIEDNLRTAIYQGYIYNKEFAFALNVVVILTDFSVLDLKSYYRGRRYASEIINMLPQKPDAILLADIFQQNARLGAIHPVFQPSASP